MEMTGGLLILAGAVALTVIAALFTRVRKASSRTVVEATTVSERTSTVR